MKRRWHLLGGSALTALIGTSWLAHRLHLPISFWVSVWLLGLMGSAAIAGWAAYADVRARWPAALALLGAAPAGQLLLFNLDANLWSGIRFLGLPYVLVLAGIASTVVTAIVILARKVPTREPPIAPARIER
jgi:hypothetical protein